MNGSIKIITDCELDKKLNITNEHSDLNVIIIDNRIIWYGSINPFAYASKEDTILRIDDIEYVKEILNF